MRQIMEALSGWGWIFIAFVSGFLLMSLGYIFRLIVERAEEEAKMVDAYKRHIATRESDPWWQMVIKQGDER